jgi:CheY-like chemotaxis protein
VAHDFNNLLTVINGYAELLLNRLGPDDPSMEFLKQIKAAGERAALLTGQLLAFSRRQVLEPKVLDLNAAITEMEPMLCRMIGEDVELTTRLDPALACIQADPSQLQQVLLNLTVNARDAMPRGSQLTLETRNAVIDPSSADSLSAMRPGRYVLLAVTDTVRGMDEATRVRIFEPFFTTKGTGKGTGLGLATVYGIVTQSGGFIQVRSVPGQGATFAVYLPQIEEFPEAPQTQPDFKELPGGPETVLLLEDEEVVRAFARRVLHLFGYTVLEASTSPDAIHVGTTHSGPIHLLATDVVLPHLGGREVADALLRARPGLKVLYFSGYTDDEVLRRGVQQAEMAFLHKPFSASALVLKVREVLDQ